MKNWAQNKKNPANRKDITFRDVENYGDITTTIAFVSAISTMKRRAREKERKRKETYVE